MTGERVLIAGPEAGWKLAGLSREALADPVGTVAAGTVSGLRLIPYQAVGTGQGFMVALHCDSVKIGGCAGSNLVAFSPQSFPGGEYQALTGGQYG